VTLEDILEEIVGEFTTDPATMMHKDVHSEADGSFVVNGSATIRALNRSMRWNLPTDGPKTLNGLIVEFLEPFPNRARPENGGLHARGLQTGDNAIRAVRIRPPEPTRLSSPGGEEASRQRGEQLPRGFLPSRRVLVPVDIRAPMLLGMLTGPA